MARISCLFMLLCGVISSVENKEKFGCTLPPEPVFGKFVFDERKRSLGVECDEDYYITGRRKDRERRCRDGDWTGTDWKCLLKQWVQDQCPKQRAPRNGEVFGSGTMPGDKVMFQCDEGYVMQGSSEATCLKTRMWTGIPPVCSSRKTAEDVARAIKSGFVDTFSSVTATSDTGEATSRLAPGKSGLDVIMAVDTSSSISYASLQIAKNFMKLLVDIFGISKDPMGGGNGTRFAVMTFTDTASVLFNLDDPVIRSTESANAKIDKIMNSGGGTDIRNILDSMFTEVVMMKMIATRNNPDTSRAVFLITDAEQTVHRDAGKIMSRAESLKSILDKTKVMKHHRVEIFTLGVGRHVDKFALANIASPPYEEHVFIINKYQDLKRISDVIAERNIDYSRCGISGNIEIQTGTHKAKKGAWPWIGWVSAGDKTCGGLLLSDRWFMTTANCVSRVDEEGHVVPYTGAEINVYLGDYELYSHDNEEQSAVVAHVHLHSNYSGLLKSHGIRDYDVALLDLGSDNTSRPVLNKYIKPICTPQGDVKSYSSNLLLNLKAAPHSAQGYTAGWGHAPNNNQQQYAGSHTTLPFFWAVQKQNERAVQSDRSCANRYRDLDVDRFFCVGNRISESDSCRGDIGGPYMAEMDSHRFVALGLALKTDNCLETSPKHLSIFLDLNHDSVAKWVNKTISNVENPFVEPEQDESEEGKIVVNDPKADALENIDEDDANNEAGHGGNGANDDEGNGLKDGVIDAVNANIDDGKQVDEHAGNVEVNEDSDGSEMIDDDENDANEADGEDIPNAGNGGNAAPVPAVAKEPGAIGAMDAGNNNGPGAGAILAHPGKLNRLKKDKKKNKKGGKKGKGKKRGGKNKNRNWRKNNKQQKKGKGRKKRGGNKI